MAFFLSFPRGFFRLGWRFPSFAGHSWRWGSGGREVKVAACGVVRGRFQGRDSVTGTNRDIPTYRSFLTSPSSSITSCLTSYDTLG